MTASVVVFTLFLFQPALADPLVEGGSGCTEFDPSDPYGIKCGEATKLSTTDPRLLVGRIINVALSLLGILSVVIIVYAGFKWMTSGGNEENAKSAQKILMAAVIGLVIILSAYAISNFILKELYKATTGESAYPQ